MGDKEARVTACYRGPVGPFSGRTGGRSVLLFSQKGDRSVQGGMGAWDRPVLCLRGSFSFSYCFLLIQYVIKLRHRMHNGCKQYHFSFYLIPLNSLITNINHIETKQDDK